MESYKDGVKAKLPALTLYIGLVVIFIVFAVICSMMGKNFQTLIICSILLPRPALFP